MADFYALQKSRRQFGGSRLEESSEVDDDDDQGNEEEGSRSSLDGRRYTHGGGLRSSWHGKKRERDAGRRRSEQESPSENDTNKATMFDVKLDASVEPSYEGGSSQHEQDEQPEDDDDPPAFQQFQKPPMAGHTRFAHGAFLPYETPAEDVLDRPRPPSSDTSSVRVLPPLNLHRKNLRPSKNT